MGYKLIDVNGNEISLHNLQDKGVWCKAGASKEEGFVGLYGKKLNLKINPEKENDPYAPDLVNTRNGLLADLKIQNTPFFQAKARFGLDPQYTVVFNKKDKLRYKAKYPDIEIYFAVDWQAIKFVSAKTIEVLPMVGVWFIPFGKLDVLLKSAPLHEYVQRMGDTQGNARESYVLDLKNSAFKKAV